MARLEDITVGSSVKGIVANDTVTIVAVQWYGTNVIEITYKNSAGALGAQMIYRENEPNIEVMSGNLPWSFDADGAQMKLASEAYRISLAHLFDPYLAVHTSSVEPMTDADNSSSENDENSVISENSSFESEEISTAYDESSSAELITDAETIKSLIDDCIEENGFKLGVGVEIQDSKNWLPDEPDHEIVIVGLSVDYNRRSEIENWDEYLGEISDKVLECISDNNIDENYVIVYLYE